jgi:hypothetical protein
MTSGQESTQNCLSTLSHRRSGLFSIFAFCYRRKRKKAVAETEITLTFSCSILLFWDLGFETCNINPNHLPGEAREFVSIWPKINGFLTQFSSQYPPQLLCIPIIFDLSRLFSDSRCAMLQYKLRKWSHW